MTFDPRAELDPFEDEEAWSAWIDQLMDQFADSPEAHALGPDVDVSWSGLFLEFAATHHSDSLATLRPDAVESVLLIDFPRTVSVLPEGAGDIVRELRAFFAFAERAFKLSNLAACARVLEPDMVQRVTAALADTSMYGVAKSFLMSGAEHSFDMDNEEDLEAWSEIQYSEIVGDFDADILSEVTGSPPSNRKANPARKAARKRQKKARRKNRK